MADDPALVHATIEIMKLQRELLGEIRFRERAESFHRNAKHKRKLAEEKVASLEADVRDLQKRVEAKQTAFDHATSSLTEDVKKAEERWHKIEVERQALLTQVQKLRALLPKMKEGPNGCPLLCLRCGKKKGLRAYTCPPCFDFLHREGIDEDRVEWRTLRDAWQTGERDFPRP